MDPEHNGETPGIRRPGRFWILAMLSLPLVVPVAGCRFIRTTAELPGRAVGAVTPGAPSESGVEPSVLQQDLMRFADSFSSRMIVGIERVLRDTTRLTTAEALRWNIAIDTGTSSIVTGPNPVANLLDLTAFVTVIRMTLEEYWQPQMLGESGQPLVDSARAAETAVWTLAARVLGPEQQAELRQAIETWHRDNPLPGSALATRAVGFTSNLPQIRPADTGHRDSMLNLLSLDPLAGLDPATRELAEGRMLAERALFLAHHLPDVLRWQTELLALNSSELPAMQQLLTNTTAVATSLQRFSTTAEQLPGQVATEREKILEALRSQEAELATLAREIRQGLMAGTAMSTSLNTTLTTFDALMNRFGVGATNDLAAPAPAPPTNSEPFRIKDYEETARQLELTARQLTELLGALNQTMNRTDAAQLAEEIRPVIGLARDSSNDVVDRAFWKGLILIGAALVAALLYRLLSVRLIRNKP